MTVVLPTWNRSGFLRHALASALAQTRTDFVVLVCDNASTDDTPAFMATVDDPRVEYVRRPVNLGLTGNFNDGLARATTPYVALLLDDDAWCPEYLARTVPVLEANPHVGVVHTAFRELDPDGRPVSAYADWKSPGPGVTGVRPGRALIADLLGAQNPVMVSSLLMRTEALFPEPWAEVDRMAEDVGALLRIALAWDVAFVAEPLADFRMHAAQVSTSGGTFLGELTVPGFAQVAEWAAAKRRFLRERGDELGDRMHWERVVTRKLRKDAVWSVRHLTTAGSVRDTIRLLREAAPHAPGLWREPRAAKVVLEVAARQLRRGLPSRAGRRLEEE